MESLAALPLPVLKLVLALADDFPHGAVAPLEPYVPTALLDRLEQSHAALWAPVIKQLRDELEVALSITLVQPLDRHPISTLLDGAAWKPAPLRSLKLLLDRSNDDDGEPEAETLSDDMHLAWRRMLVKVPQLERLDVRSFSLDSPQLPLILEAASIACPRLKSLVLGSDLRSSAADQEAPLENLRRTLYRSMARWREAEPDGGLQQLEFPLRYAGREVENLARLTMLEAEFIDSLAKFCPNLQYLNALGAPPELHGELLKLKAAVCPPAQWQRFCDACTSLVHADWMNFPYSDQHFAMFSAKPKANLKVLHFNATEGEHVVGADGKGLYTGAGVAGMLDACRNLTELRIKFDHSLSIPNGFILQPQWSDEVLFATARSCPKLEVFTLLEFDQPGGGANIPTPLDTITDAGVSALATLPELRAVKMKATRVTGRGLFELVRHAPTRDPPRKIKLEVGCLLLEGFVDDQEEELVIFHDVVLSLLEHIAKSPELIKGRHFVVNLRNRSRSDSDTNEWREKLHKLIKAVPVNVQVLEEFSRIERVILRS